MASPRPSGLDHKQHSKAQVSNLQNKLQPTTHTSNETRIIKKMTDVSTQVIGPSRAAFSAEHYTIGCICALHTESVALRAFLDDEHENLEGVAREDHNAYILGRMGGHNVVIAVLPGEYGTASAASVAKDMLHTFTHLRVGFMVGIGGGAPTKDRDIRLGDVVVSYPRNGHGGVFQYDFGKNIQDGNFIHTAVLDQPPEMLRAVVTAIRSDYDFRGHNLHQNIAEVLQRNRRLRKNYSRPDRSSDILFASDFVHLNDENGRKRPCADACSSTSKMIIDRDERTEDDEDPAVHYGLIASANQVMKDAKLRDAFAEKNGVLCFEMEAAGLMNRFPCLVIRGICDYSDTHKNDQWHGYAAMTAAAFAKDVIVRLIPNKVASEKKIFDALSEIEGGIEKLAVIYLNNQCDQDYQQILDWLTLVDYSTKQNALNQERQQGTGTWFLNTEPFHRWREKKGGILFCPGIPGAGKTFITSLVIQHLHATFEADSDVGIAYLYCNYRELDTQRLDDLLLTLLRQLAGQMRPFPQVVVDAYYQHKKAKSRPSCDELAEMLRVVISSHERVFIIIDGLDECQVNHGTREKLLDTIFTLHATTQVSILATSRYIQDMEKRFDGRAVVVVIKASEEDVGLYLDGRIPHILPFVTNTEGLQKSVKNCIMKASNGMFLLARLHLNSLRGQVNVKQVKYALQQLSSGESGLESAYEKTMEMIQGQAEGQRDIAMQTLAWITFGHRTIMMRELQHALAIEIGKTSLDLENITIADVILSACGGLITIQDRNPHDQLNSIVIVVHETTQNYFERTSHRWFDDPYISIAQKCTTYLLFDAFGGGPCATMESYEDRLWTHPFYNYAVSEWSTQMPRLSQPNPETEVLLVNLLLSAPHVHSYAQAYTYGCDRSRYPTSSIEFGRSGAMSSLHLAVALRLNTSIPKLVHTEPNSLDSRGFTALHLAVQKNFVDTVQILLSMPEVDCNALDSQKRTPLFYASTLGYKEVSRLLFSTHKTNLNIVNGEGMTPLSWAAREGRAKFVALLCSRQNIDVNWTHPLCWAARKGNTPIIKILLSQPKTDVNALDGDGMSALHWAIASKHIEATRILLANDKINPNIPDSKTRTPLWWTLANIPSEGYEQVAKTLVARPDVTIHPETIDTPNVLYMAAKSGSNEVVALLIKLSKIPIHLSSPLGRSPLKAAIAGGHKVTVCLLLDSLEIDFDHYAHSIILGGVKIGSSDMVALLLSKLMPYVEDKEEYLLQWIELAARAGRMDMVRTLFHSYDEHSYDEVERPEDGSISTLSDRTSWDSFDVIKWVARVRGANTNSSVIHDETRLLDAATHGNMTNTFTVDVMATSANIRDKKGSTFAHYADMERLSAAKNILVDCLGEKHEKITHNISDFKLFTARKVSEVEYGGPLVPGRKEMVGDLPLLNLEPGRVIRVDDVEAMARLTDGRVLFTSEGSVAYRV
ncbi:hypothetical protein K505DRAFT_377712 [Melanomma pulvis-pyrius CBS 109.77]|uniref:Uncharacterized protein n=1 Tax=Melanomma pulvis-pyrius CBS 109.77 TaxID=1314802 RepID=A0A6A6X1Y4_9PLEO|nr:hypothetical protein K505DRAFT_377712 [Melanomma pulvis-pyrius CBS 109.77]